MASARTLLPLFPAAQAWRSIQTSMSARHRQHEEKTHASAVALAAVRIDSRKGNASAGWWRLRDSERETSKTRRKRHSEGAAGIAETESERMRPEIQNRKARKGRSNQRVETTSVSRPETRERFPFASAACSVSHS